MKFFLFFSKCVPGKAVIKKNAYFSIIRKDYFIHIFKKKNEIMYRTRLFLQVSTYDFG